MAAGFFDVALWYCLANEGGAAFTNAPLDRGGPTKYGVTMATLSSYRGTPQTADDVQAMTLCDAEAIYRRLYWTPLRLDSVASRPVATAMLDVAVLCGPACSARMAQSAVAVKTDGVVGPVTLAALNAASPARFVSAVSTSLMAYLGGIVARDPSQSRWLTGWNVRARKLATLANVSVNA